MFSDGYSDQFSGRSGKKLMVRRFKQTLLEICNKSMREQGFYLEQFSENWRNGCEQVDILVTGVRL